MNSPSKESLENNPEVYSSFLVAENYIRKRIIKRVVDFAIGKTALSMGYMKDNWVDELLDKGFQRVDIVEGSATFVEDAKKRYSNSPVNVYHSLFEEFTPPP